MTLELGVCLHVGHAVAAVRGELDVTVTTNRPLRASADAPKAARHPGVWTATVPGYADG